MGHATGICPLVPTVLQIANANIIGGLYGVVPGSAAGCVAMFWWSIETLCRDATCTDILKAYIAGITVTAEGAVVQAAGLNVGYWGLCIS